MKNHCLFALVIACLSTAYQLPAQEPEFGYASYYSDDFQGGRTAYGDIYDKNKLTAAHKFFPYGAKIKVTRLDNKKSVVVTVTDKGPFVKGRVVDLSRAAASRLGLIEDGIAEVKIELVSLPKKDDEPEKTVDAAADAAAGVEVDPKDPTSYTEGADRPRIEGAKAETGGDAPAPPSITSTEKAKAAEKPKAENEETEKRETREAAKKESRPDETEKKPASADNTSRLVGKDYSAYGLYKIRLERPSRKGYGVQVASLSNHENMMKHVADLQAKWFDNVLVSVEKGDSNNAIYKIILGPFDSESAAKNYQASIKKKHKMNGFVVNLTEITY